MSNFKQIIIARKDLNMSAGKLAAQVSHASMAFLTTQLRETAVLKDNGYEATMHFGKDVFEEWFLGPFTKCILEAKNKNQLIKAKEKAEEAGMVEGKDFFLIKDNCYTELTPEEYDKDGQGHTLTCIGFRPMEAEAIDPIGKKYQLWKS